jgi:ABC-type branched-subunit amino acid transport system substrate-binding protein
MKRRRIMSGKIGKALLVVCMIAFISPFTAFSGDEILVGAPLPLTGPYASDGEQMRMALELAIEEKNAAGGLLGKQLKLITGDVGALEPEKIRAVGERLAGFGVNVAITGYADSGVDARVFGQFQFPYIHGDAMSADSDIQAAQIKKSGSSNVFQYCPTEIEMGKQVANHFLEEIPNKMGWKPPNKKCAVITTDYSWSIIASDEFKRIAKKRGYSIVVDETIQFGMVEFGPILSKIDQLRPAYVSFWDLSPQDSANFIKQFHDKFASDGIQSIIYMQYSPQIPEFLDLAGKTAEGVVWNVTMAEVGENEEYDSRWKKKFGVPTVSSYCYGTRDAFDMWIKAVEEVGSVDDYKKIISKLSSMKHHGMIGTIQFNPKNNTALAGSEYVPIIMHQVWGGKNNRAYPFEFSDKGYKYQIPVWIK